MSTTVREALNRELASHEFKVSQLRGKREVLKQQCPELLDLEVPLVRVHTYGKWLQIIIKDQGRAMPELPSKLATITDNAIAFKHLDQDSEAIDFSIDHRIDLKLRRAPRRPAKCRKAIVQQEIEFCGELPPDMEVIEWIEE